MLWRDAMEVVIALIQLVVIPALGFGLRLMHELHREMRAINGRLVALEQWRQDHVDEADRRFADWIQFVRDQRRSPP